MQPQTDDPIVAAYVAGEKVRSIPVDRRTLYRRLRKAGAPLRGYAQAGGAVPVYDEAGEPFAISVSAAARRLGCHPSNLTQHHLEDYRDGYRLKSRPRRKKEAPDAA